MIRLTPHPSGLVLAVRARPGARVSAVLGEHDGALRVAVAQVPEKGKANAAVARALADALGCKPSQVELLTGPTSRAKTFLISGFDPSDLRARLDALAGADGRARGGFDHG